jgi:hypothetical protein
MIRIILLITMFIPAILHADEGLNLSCKNMLSAFGRNYEPLNFKLEVTGFHYFDKDQKKFKIIPAKDLEYGEDRFTAKFPAYELGFQRIVFAGDTKSTITMSKYDRINNKFIDHYECSVVRAYID